MNYDEIHPENADIAGRTRKKGDLISTNQDRCWFPAGKLSMNWEFTHIIHDFEALVRHLRPSKGHVFCVWYLHMKVNTPTRNTGL
jgi:hypothetical protein